MAGEMRPTEVATLSHEELASEQVKIKSTSNKWQNELGLDSHTQKGDWKDK